MVHLTSISKLSRDISIKADLLLQKIALERTMCSDIEDCSSLQSTCDASSAMWYINTPKYLLMVAVAYKRLRDIADESLLLQ